MKKILALLLALGLVIVGAGCSGSITESALETPAVTEQTENQTAAEDGAGSTAEPARTIDDIVEPMYDDMKVHFLDVGQGDSIFVELPNGQAMLIDAGNSHNGSDIVSYIKNLQYSSIDFVIATHPHADHIGGMAQVLNSFDVGAVYMPKKEHTSRTFENLLDTIEAKNIALHSAKAGVVITMAGKLKTEFLAPIGDGYTNLNNWSAVLKIAYGETEFLFTGDAEHEVETELLSSGKPLQADVIKVGHHGSHTASGENFIKAVSPSYAVISCGQGNSYGHPHSEVLAVFQGQNINVYRTDEVGTIVITADSHEKITVDKKASEIKENAPPQKTQAPAVQAPIEKEAEQNTQNIGAQVFKTRTGECYHRSGCSSLSKSKIPTTVSEAKSEGLRPCKRCNPPQ